MRSLLWLVTLTTMSAGLTLAPSEAQAQTVSLTESGITRSVPLRPTSFNPYWTNRADCDGDDVYSFPAHLSGFPTDGSVVLQVWAGTAGVDCTVTTNRSTATQQCWKVADDYQPVEGSDPIIKVGVRSMLAGGLALGNGKPSQSVLTGDASTCATAAVSGPFATIVAQTVTLFFIPTQITTPVGTGYQYPIKVDLEGPAAPINVGVKVGDGSLTPYWTQVTTPDTIGYSFYCDPYAGNQGAGGSAASGGSCPSTNLIAGQVLANPAKYLCGSVTDLSATEGKATGLTNLTSYTVAVAAVDAVGNVGPLSTLACGTPQPGSDEASGGSCQVSRPWAAASGGGSALGALGAVLAGGWARRRRGTARR